MSESKYDPPVNIPEVVPDRPESILIMLVPTTQHVAFTMDKLMLKQLEPGVVAVGFVPEPGKFAPIAMFKGEFKPLIAEKTIVVP